MEWSAPSFLPLAFAMASAFERALVIAAAVAASSSACAGCRFCGPPAPPLPAVDTCVAPAARAASMAAMSERTVGTSTCRFAMIVYVVIG